MNRRAHRRVPAQLQGFLLGNAHEIEAVTLDLSIGGGTSLHRRCTRAVGGEDMFGVSFRNVRPTELNELEQLIDEFEETEDSGHA